MVRDETIFNEEDFRILDSYKKMTEGLADYLGPCYEIVLHSLHNLSNSVIAIVNGHYTGRTVGSPVTDLALKMLHDIETKGGQDFISYHTRSQDNQPLRSTTIAIRGTQNKIIGLLCINLHMEASIATFMHHIVDDYYQPGSANVLAEQFSEDIEHLLHTSLEQVRASVMNDITVSASNKNREIIIRLYQKGIFSLKNAVNYVANELGISRNTVYLHLRSLNGKASGT